MDSDKTPWKEKSLKQACDRGFADGIKAAQEAAVIIFDMKLKPEFQIDERTGGE